MNLAEMSKRQAELGVIKLNMADAEKRLKNNGHK